MKSIPVRIGILKCWFLEERGKPQNPKKSLLKQVGRTSFLGPGRRVFPPPVFVFLRRRPNAVIMTGLSQAAHQQGREPTTNSTHIRDSRES